jgi:hypothetical protein
VFVNIEIHKEALLEELHTLDRMEEVRALVAKEKFKEKLGCQ